MPKPDYQAFANSFLDLWQEQIARAMSDTDFLQTLMDNMQQMQGGMFSHESTAQQSHEHASDASGIGADELADLRQRLGAAERKIVRLEAKLERLKDDANPKTKSAAKKPAKAPAEKPTAKRAGTGRTAKAVAKPAAKKPAAKSRKKSTARKRAVKRR